MAKTRVKADFKDAKKKFKSFSTRAIKILENKYPDIIIKEIEGGRSPVKGKGRFTGYSSSYKKAISNGEYSKFSKNKRPVNLKLSGELLDSLSAKRIKNGLRITFDNFLADIHNRLGAGKSKTVRRMLPTNKGEQFNESIQRDVKKLINRIAKSIFK